MQVALLTTFAVTKKEPLAVLLERIHAAFLAAGLGEPSVLFTFSDPPVPGAFFDHRSAAQEVSGVRAFHRARDLRSRMFRRFARYRIGRALRVRVNPSRFRRCSRSPRAFRSRCRSTAVSIHFHSPAFGVQFPLGNLAPIDPGVMVTDSWWVNGRNRGVSALTSVEADPAGKKLPPLPERVAAVFAACGKIKRTVQVPLAAAAALNSAAAVRAAVARGREGRERGHS